MRLYNDLRRFQQALLLGRLQTTYNWFIAAGELVRELKKVDDKDLIVEVELEESKAFTALGNLGRARAALTSARTTANAIYVAPVMQVLQNDATHVSGSSRPSVWNPSCC